jgi:hypothetical protein
MVSLRMRFPARLTRSALLAVCLLSAVGCYGDDFYVSGKVTVADAPVPGGTVYFTDFGDNNDIRSANILSDGTYAVTKLLQGHTYTITLTNPEAPLPGVIPERYADPNKSGLSYTTPSNAKSSVSEGYTHDIPLSP